MESIGWFEPFLDKEDMESVKSVVESNFVNEGKKTKEFEDLICKRLNVKYAIATTNGTSAIYLALMACDVGSGDEVMVPDMTFIATANAVKMTGAKVVLCDINRKDFTISIEDIKKKITDKTKAIVPVDIFGRSPDFEELKKIAKEKDIKIIEDAAGALGSNINGKYMGTIGDLGAISFAPTKIITTAQGGVVLTNNEELALKVRKLKDHGREKRSDKTHPEFGFNFKFNDVCAAIGISQINKLDDRIKHVNNIRRLYEKELNNVGDIEIPPMDIKKGIVPLWTDILTSKSKELQEYLLSKNIHTRKFWVPIHKNNPYLDNDNLYPISNEVYKKGLWLPGGPTLDLDNVVKICKHIKEFYNN